jgi:hypothetical protein
MLGSFSGFIIVLLAHFVKAKNHPAPKRGWKSFEKR